MLQIQSRVLRIDDPSRISVVSREKIRFEDQIFDLYIPADSKFELRIKVESIGYRGGYTKPVARCPIPAGKVAIQVVDDRHSPNVVVMIDGNIVLDVQKAKHASSSSRMGTSEGYRSCTSFDANETICLFDRELFFSVIDSVFNKSTSLTQAQCDELNAKDLGVFIWIQQVE